jgi:hypothetical protein
LWDLRTGPFQDEYGAGSSPIPIGDKLILQQDHDIDSFCRLRYRERAAVYETRPGTRFVVIPRPALVNRGPGGTARRRRVDLAGYDPQTVSRP